MPRKSRLLPYLRESKSGRLEFVRRVPPELQKYLGDRRYLTRVLPVDSTNVRDRAVIRAWTAVNGEIEAELAQAKEQYARDNAPTPEPTPLSPRDAAGIAAEPWRQLLQAGEQGRITADMEELLANVVLTAFAGLPEPGQPADKAAIETAKAAITERMVGKTLDKLQIQPDSQAMQQIQQRLLGYARMIGADVEKREAGDFSDADIQTKAPALPKAQLTFDRLLEAWLADVGGITERDGIGVSEERVSAYRRTIEDLIAVTGCHFPAEVGIEEARQYFEHLQSSSWAIATRQKRLGTINNLYSLSVRLGLLDVNPFSEFKLKIPKGTRTSNYRPFTRDELIAIFSRIKEMPSNERKIVPLILLMTGARLSDVVYLRHTDVKRTEAGIYYFDFKHEPQHKYPRLLKGGESDERHTPLHPLLIEREFLKMIKPRQFGYLFSVRDNDLISAWFQRILVRLGIYEKRVTVLHSLRGTAIDAWRSARLPEDVRRALTAHSSRDVQERVYGQGLEQMPDVLFKELSKVDWSWLP